ncbi:GntR family transcriptional regulator [Solibacillus sp. MA9]|uniref:GntR family transcriptional regulator n=1 Tax=Solibacillus palustris TaxID=2908203 RepID=A0ABS9UF42_9BACL|nr:TrkA C-terminal domain-containing protein [Solibacillus sp. MA9]MCH7322755.1 GntR family transcriptional regulator [Solibacillus sp. MA9]
MEKKLPVKQPKYQLIAEDIAGKIVEGKYEVGEKIYARSSIATQYGVSAETARRAIAVLQDLNIVEATKGSGVIIQSYERAVEFVHRLKDVKSVRILQNELENSIERQKKELEDIQSTLFEFINRTNRLQSINPFIPFQIEVTSHCLFLNKNIGELLFWQQTGATIIAIKKETELVLSPGPYAILQAGDVLYFIGNEQSYSVVQQFLNS